MQNFIDYNAMETLSLIANICGILGFLISLFVATNVYYIRKEQNNNNVKISGETHIDGNFTGRDSNNNVKVLGKTDIGGDFVGRDKK